MKIEIGDREYEVKLAATDEERILGLQGVKSLPEDEGMLFIYEEPSTVGYQMKEVLFPLDIIFIDKNLEVISIFLGEPGSTVIAEEDNVVYVLEVNANSGIEVGDEMEYIDDEDEPIVMLILGAKGKVLGEVEEGSRIVSRKETRVLIRKAKKAYKSKTDTDYKALGKYMFAVLDGQDSREPLYTSVPD